MLKCEDCNWWKPIGKNGQNNGVKQGQCRRRPPSTMPVVMPVLVSKITGEVRPQIVEVTLWPTLPAFAEACGDFLTASIKAQGADIDIKTNNRGVIQAE